MNYERDQFNSWGERHAEQRRAAGITCRAPVCFKGDSESSSSTSTTNLGASDHGRIFQVTGGIKTQGDTSFGGGRLYQDKDGHWQWGVPPASGSASGVVYTESGGTTLFGQGNTLNVTDGGATAAALEQVGKTSSEALKQLKELVADKTPDASVQNKQLAYAAIVGLMAVSGLYFLGKGKS